MWPWLLLGLLALFTWLLVGLWGHWRVPVPPGVQERWRSLSPRLLSLHDVEALAAELSARGHVLARRPLWAGGPEVILVEPDGGAPVSLAWLADHHLTPTAGLELAVHNLARRSAELEAQVEEVRRTGQAATRAFPDGRAAERLLLVPQLLASGESVLAWLHGPGVLVLAAGAQPLRGHPETWTGAPWTGLLRVSQQGFAPV